MCHEYYDNLIKEQAKLIALTERKNEEDEASERERESEIESEQVLWEGQQVWGESYQLPQAFPFIIFQ